VKEATPAPPPANAPAEEDEEGEEHMDVAFIQGFAEFVSAVKSNC
jgi:hypothetical protein